MGTGWRGAGSLMETVAVATSLGEVRCPALKVEHASALLDEGRRLDEGV